MGGEYGRGLCYKNSTHYKKVQKACLQSKSEFVCDDLGFAPRLVSCEQSSKRGFLMRLAKSSINIWLCTKQPGASFGYPSGTRNFAIRGWTSTDGCPPLWWE